MRISTLSILFLIIFIQVQAQEIAPRPDVYIPVYDDFQLLNKDENKKLTAKLIAYEDSTSTQIQIVIIDSLRGFSIESYANKWANEWGIGQKGSDNGLLIFIAFNDRSIRIEVGYGLEDKISDAVAKDIINNYFIPYFRNKDYLLAFEMAISEIQKHLSGFYTNHDRYSKYYDHSLDRSWYKFRGEEKINLWFIIIAAIVFNIWTFANYRKKYISGKKKTVYEQIFWHILGTTLLFLYLFLLGKSIDPEPGALMLHFVFSAVLTVVMLSSEQLKIKNWKIFFRRLGIFIALWALGFIILKLMIDDKITNMEGFLQFLTYGFIFAVAVSLFYWILIFIKNSESGSGSGSSSNSYSSSYKSSGSSSFKSSGSSFKSSSSSSSSYGGGSFGGGGASGKW
jgi:uncharacterized membrane protein YgcG